MSEERRLAAIMFSDICGFSRIMGADEERGLAIIEMHKQCVTDGTLLHGGRIAKEMGDGLLVEFSSAVNAVRCAVAVQRAVLEFNKTAEPDESFQLRIGIHVGDVVVAGEDILGDGVNVASRIEPLAEPGGICISRDIFDLVRNKISIETVHLGAHDLKNISRQVSIYKVLLDAVAPGDIPIPTITRKRPLLRYGLIAAGVLILLAAGFAFQQHHKRSKQGAASLSQQQTSPSAVEKPRAAHTVPNPSRLPAPSPHTPSETDALSEEGILKHRHIGFVKAVIDKNHAKALSFLSPTTLEKANKDMIWRRLQLVSNLFQIHSRNPDDLKIKSVNVLPNGESAEIVMQYRKPEINGNTEPWNDTKPAIWKKIDNTWYLHFEGKQDAFNPSGNRHPQFPRNNEPAGTENRRPLRNIRRDNSTSSRD